MNPVAHALQAYIERALAITDTQHFWTEFDPEWRSPCELDITTPGNIGWRPVPQQPMMNFDGLANALEQPIHEDIRTFYTSYWSGHLSATADDGEVNLIQLWNPEDFERLIENLVGHSLAKQRLKQPFTVFIATTEPDSELFISIDNSTGNILLEEPGRPPIRTISASLGEFLDRLTPVTEPREMNP
ncbi:MAG: SecY interacting protein Syd [Candidatus Pseudothioglobus sp.]|jgi:SecY interacting protein Syd